MTDPSVVAWFAAAARYLHRTDLRCPQHRIAHTGKLARAIPIDLALLDATGDPSWWDLAIERARWVAGRAGPDPEHGALIYLPGRLDPRNCSNSVIDSGECSGALAALLRHPRSSMLAPVDREQLETVLQQNCDTYLAAAVVEKEITNQRLWGAMGLAAASALWHRPEWLEALRQSLLRSIDEQRADGSWAYQAAAPHYGAHPGAADVTVYYHGRCLAFLVSILRDAPEADPGDGWAAVERGLHFLAAVTAPDGLKPLALEGKRWFWESQWEAGSNAYDLFVLLSTAEKLQEPEWARLARPVWRQLRARQDTRGAIHAGEAGASDFVCADFHTADLAWPARVLSSLPHARVDAEPPDTRASRIVSLEPSGIVRLDAGSSAVMIRTHKQPRNTQWGGAVGGGVLAHASRGAGPALAAVDRDSVEVPGSVVLYPPRPHPVRALRRFLRDNRPNREGRQWFFVARVLLSERRPVAAGRRMWRGLVRPLLRALAEPAATHLATHANMSDATPGQADRATICAVSVPALDDGCVPDWVSGTQVSYQYEAGDGGLSVTIAVRGAERAARVVVRVPDAASSLEIESSVPVRRARGSSRRVVAYPRGAAVTLDIRYRL